MAFFKANSKQTVNNLACPNGTSCRRSERHYHSKNHKMVLFDNYDFWRRSSIHSPIQRNIHQSRCRRLFNVCLSGSFSGQHFKNIILVSIFCFFKYYVFKMSYLILGLVNVMSFHCYFKVL